MSRAYLRLFAAGMLAALAVALLARMPRRASAPAAVAVVVAPARALEAVVRDGVIAPDPLVVPKGARVRLSVRNGGTVPVHLALTGYAARVHADAIIPGATWSVEFTADLPGDDFAFLVDDKPAGRFSVTGSHLVEGHR